MMRGNGVVLHAAKTGALGPFHSRGRQINAWRGCGCCFSAAGSITSPANCAVGLGTQAWWDPDLAGGLCSYIQAAYFQLEYVLYFS